MSRQILPNFAQKPQKLAAGLNELQNSGEKPAPHLSFATRQILGSESALFQKRATPHDCQNLEKSDPAGVVIDFL